MRRTISTALLVAIALLVVLPLGTHAANPGPLPDFQVFDSNGAPVESKDISGSGKWLLIYVQTGNSPSAALLKQLQTEHYSGVADSAVIIVSGITADKLGDFSQKNALLANAKWYADPTGKAMQPLKLSGVPVILGMSDRNVSWTLAGILRDQDRMESIVMSWVTGSRS